MARLSRVYTRTLIIPISHVQLELFSFAPLRELVNDREWLQPTGLRKSRSRARRSRLGGNPEPFPEHWPEGPNGPFSFVGQLDFGELRAHEVAISGLFPTEGTVALFVDLEAPWGPPASACLLYSSGPVEAEGEAPAPPDPPYFLEPYEKEHSGQQLGGQPIWVQGDDLWGAFFGSGAYLNTPASEALRALNIREDIFVNGTDEERLEVGRRFEEVDFDPAPFAEALLEWVLLWQIDIGEDFDLDGDHGWFTIYVFIQRHRLKARDFANCMVILQNT